MSPPTPLNVMRSVSPKPLNYLAALCCSMLFALAPASTEAQRQSTPARTQRASGTTAQQSSSTNHSRASRELLNEVAERARTFDDLYQRAHVQALAADALWPFDRERARAIFLRAWEAATASDRAEQEEEERATAPSSSSTRESVTEARDEVLSKAAARDAALGEKFLRELLAAENDEDNAGQNSSSSQNASSANIWRESSPQSARRIALGYELLERGDSVRAFQIVLPAAREGVNASLMAFSIRLRWQDEQDGNKLLRALIEAARNDPRADANTILLLSTPTVSPELFVAVDEHGSLQYRSLPRLVRLGSWSLLDPRIVLTREDNAAFYDVSARILLRPILQDSAGAQREAIANFFAITRLLPFFVRDAQQFVPELQARANSLAEEIETSRRDYLKAQSEVTPAAPEHASDPLRTQSDQLAHARTEAERQRVYLSMVKTAVSIRAWDRARRAAENIEDLNMRHAALSFIALNQIADISRAYADEREDDYESVLKFVDTADVPPLARAWGYAQAAEIAARKKKNKQRAVELLTEAGRWADRVDAETPERVAAYAVVATSAARVDEERAWGALHDAVKSANSVEDFSGEQVAIAIYADQNRSEEREPDFSFTSDTFRLDKIFAKMARLNFDEALIESRALGDGVPRSIAQIAIARAILERVDSR